LGCLHRRPQGRHDVRNHLEAPGHRWALVATVPLSATGAQIAAKAHGISAADADALARAVHKPKPTT
jgi:hypothetical protein